MLKKLIKLQNISRTKLSGFPVSAILVMKDGTEVSGINIESEIPSTSVCAERSAIICAINAGYEENDFKEFHILGGNESSFIISPCGTCRQFIFEVNSNIIVYMYNKNGKIKIAKIGELLPLAFKNKEVN
jgi:cytidine deaminase